jgi:heparinase III protein
MHKFKYLCISLALITSLTVSATDAGQVLDYLDLTRRGLEKVDVYHRKGEDSLAAVALLDYYRNRTGVKSIGADMTKVTLSETERRRADDALQHIFYVHDGYQPSFFYGKDINWEYWPVKDHELRWQLHRHKWWIPMGKAYRVTVDEKYAEEWVFQYRDWIKKNPLTEYIENPDRVMENAENVYFAWRPLEVSGRLANQIDLFRLFLPSTNFTPEFLIEFLDNYHRHAVFTDTHYSDQGNHLLFEAQYIIQAGSFFPEFKEAAAWRKAGIDILNREIKKQVYADGVQYELDPGYHMGTIESFSRGLLAAHINGYDGEFGADYVATIERMIEFVYNLMFPDYTQPTFSDNKFHDKKHMKKRFLTWQPLFPNNEQLNYFATEGKHGRLPAYTSRSFPYGGFYIMRNGWDMKSTVLILKAGPKGEWHNQYDNGTFELWTDGRNFFPDSGSYIYGGDEEVLKEREWFRRTASHNTLTLDGKTLENRVSNLLKWESNPDGDIAVIETPGYKGLTHRRAVFFVDKKFYVIADEAYGTTAGNVELHYHLLPCETKEDADARALSTAFADGNNIALRVFGADTMAAEEGWFSPYYRVKHRRPAYTFGADKKTGETVRFITVIYPTNAIDPSAHKITAKYNGKPSDKGAKLEVNIDGKKYLLSYKL